MTVLEQIEAQRKGRENTAVWMVGQQLADAEKAAQEALEKARAEADASRPTEESQKKQRLADEEAVAFNLLFRQIQEQFNVLNGYLLKFQTSRPEFAAGAAKALRAMLRQWGQTVEEKTV